MAFRLEEEIKQSLFANGMITYMENQNELKKNSEN